MAQLLISPCWDSRAIDGRETPLCAVHALYGLSLGANFSLPGVPALRSEREAIDLRIERKDSSSFPSPSSFPPGDLLYVSHHHDEHGKPTLRVGRFDGSRYFVFFYSDGVRFAVEHLGREIWADWPENYTLEDACTYLVGPVMGFVLRLRGLTCLHASAIEVAGHAIALLGLPGAGKSTTAAAFAHSGFPVLSDDVVALQESGDRFLVPPGYPRVNLWPDSVRALFGAEDALPRITPTWDKRYLPLDQNGHRFASKPLPLGAIYVLGERDANLTAPVVEEVAAGEALMTLVANTYVNYLLDRDMRRREFDVLGRLLARVPLRHVRPVANPFGLSDLCETIAADARRLMVSTSAVSTPGDD